MIQAAEELEVVGAVVALPVSRIVRNPDQPRKRFHESKLQELGENIRAEGQQEPVKVFPVEDGLFMLEDGERRWLAAQKVGLSTLNCIIVSPPSQRDLLVKGIIHGLHQENLTPMEEAAAYHKLKVEHDMNTFQISKAVGRSDPFVRSRLIWMDERIPQEVRDLIDDRKFPKTPDVAEALFKLPSNEVRLKLAQRLVGKTGKGIKAACEKYLTMVAQMEAKRSAPLQNQNGKKKSIPAPIPNGQSQAGKDTPMVRQGLNGTPAPDSIALSVFRNAAAGMCRDCELSGDLIEKLPEPAWYMVSREAEKVCTRCGLSDHDLSFCKRCPAVHLLQRVVKGVQV